MLKAFQNHMVTNMDMLHGSRLLLAISGGLDSVVLAHLCHKLHLNVSLAHCNFNLRGNESDGDEAFVLQLAEDLELEVFKQNSMPKKKEFPFRWQHENSATIGFKNWQKN